MSTTQFTLNNGVAMPALGFGVFQTPPEETRSAVETALSTGYRHIDTAAAYGNERQVGEAVVKSGVDRTDIFLGAKSGSLTTATTRRCTASTRALEPGRVLLGPPAPQRRYANVGQRQRGVRRLGLGLAVQQLPADPLQLVGDRQLGRVEVDVLPAQAQHLTLAQTEHEDQDVRRVHRVTSRGGRFEERARLVAGPRLPLARPAGRRLDHACDVAADQLVGDRAGKRRPQHGPDVLAGSRGRVPLAARAYRAAPPLGLRAPGVLALRAALALGLEAVQPGLHDPSAEPVEPLVVEPGDEVEPDV